MEPLPDLATLSDADLKQLIERLTREEDEISYQRRILHGKIDILRAEYEARLKSKGETELLRQVDVDQLADILARKAAPSTDE